VNRETGEVIREIPPEKFLDMVAKLQELAGILVDEVV
jgi:flagellar protein FlaG